MGALQDTDHLNGFQNLLRYEVIEKAPEYCGVGQPYAVWVMTDKLADAAHVESSMFVVRISSSSAIFVATAPAASRSWPPSAKLLLW